MVISKACSSGNVDKYSLSWIIMKAEEEGLQNQKVVSGLTLTIWTFTRIRRVYK